MIIYTLTDPNTLIIRYVGKTKRKLIDRFYSHVSNHRLNQETSHKNSWIKSLKNNGQRPIIEILDIVPDNEWEFWEQYWISQLLSWGYKLTNMTKGGEGCHGGKGSLGYRHTQEAKNRIAEANSGTRREDWVKNTAKANQKAIIQYTLNNEQIKEWSSASEAAITLFNNIENKKNISNVMKGKRKSAYGFIWRFKNAETKDKEPL